MQKLETLLQQVQKLNTDEKYDEVIELLPLEILEKYNNADLYAEKAMALWNIKSYPDCESMAQKAIAIDKNCAKGYHYLGNISYTNENYIKSEEYYKKAIEITPNYVFPYNGLGNLHLELKNYEKSREYYLKAIEIDPSFVYSYNGIGNLFMKLKNYEKAKEYYLKAIEIDPLFSYPYHSLGNLSKELKNYEKAEKYYLKAIEIDPLLSYPYNGLGNLFKELKNYEKAEKYYLKAIEIDHKYSSPYNGLGNLYFDLEKYEKAEKYYLKAIEIDDKSQGAFYNLGLLNYSLERYDLAKENFTKYSELFSDKNDFYFKTAQSKIEEIEKILDNSSYKKISELVSKIKEMLLFKGECVTHYSTLSTTQHLILNNSPLQISEGSFLNDTSEGQELFDFIDFSNEAKNKCNEEFFTKKPFIGSFVDISKRNDLTLWRMYGKEALEEAKGCSITLKVNELKQAINAKLKSSDDNSTSKSDEIEFYRVVYRNSNSFHFAGATLQQTNKLSKLMEELKNEVEVFKNKQNKNPNEEVDIIELLNSIAYLFKSVEYQYENEIRLVINEAIGFDIKVDLNDDDFKPSTKPNKVYIELVPIPPILNDLTIGPKVDRAEEWASTFHYHLFSKGLKPEIHISKLPFK